MRIRKGGLSSGRCNLMPGLMARPTELRLNVLTQSTASATVHSSLAYTFATALHSPCQSKVSSCHHSAQNPHKSPPLTQSSQGAVSLLSSAQLPQISSLTSHLLTHCFSPKKCFLAIHNIPDPFSPQGLSYSLFVSSSCKGSSPHPSDWLSHLPQVSG